MPSFEGLSYVQVLQHQILGPNVDQHTGNREEVGQISHLETDFYFFELPLS